MSDCFTQLRADFGSISRNTFTCRGYNAADRKCKAAGIIGDAMIKFRKEQYDLAKALHDELSSE